MVTRVLDELTADDFKRLMIARFEDGADSLVDRMMENPSRNAESCTGMLAYDGGGDVMAIHGTIPRLCHWGCEPIAATCGTALAVRPDFPRADLPGFVEKSFRTTGAWLALTNTACAAAVRRFEQAVGGRPGPLSCAEWRIRNLRPPRSWLGCKMDGVRRRVLGHVRRFELASGAGRVTSSPSGEIKRFSGFAEALFEGFWERYLKGNRGLVSSRTVPELKWMWGGAISSGDAVLLGCLRESALCGFVIVRRTDPAAQGWQIADWIATDNDVEVLKSLLSAAADFLVAHTPARVVKITGFPDFIQPVVRSFFPDVKPIGWNRFFWGMLDGEAPRELADWTASTEGWFGCPYDGDMCLC